MNEREEAIWSRGRRAAWVAMLNTCLRELGHGADPSAVAASWLIEREATVAALRGLCDLHGDNDWEPDLYLPDVIEKHLYFEGEGADDA